MQKNNYLIIILLVLSLVSFTFAKDVDLQWDHSPDCTDSSCSYKIYRGQGSGHWPELLATVSYFTDTYTDVDVPEGELSWIVTAYKDELESTASNEAFLAYYYALVKFDYNASGRLLYKGENADIAALDADTDWTITKFYYNANGTIEQMRVRTTSWIDRATGW